MRRKKEENPTEERLNELNRKISIIEWDIVNIQSEETRISKQKTLESFKKELNSLTKANEQNP